MGYRPQALEALQQVEPSPECERRHLLQILRDPRGSFLCVGSEIFQWACRGVKHYLRICQKYGVALIDENGGEGWFL
jgi:hypothetical protein